MPSSGKKVHFDKSGEKSMGDIRAVQIRAGSGPSQKTFRVSLELVFRSEFLRGKWSASYRSTENTILDLPLGASVQDAELYIDFVQRRMANLSYKLEDSSEPAVVRFYHDLARIYILSRSNRINDKETRNDVVFAIGGLTRQKCTEGYLRSAGGKDGIPRIVEAVDPYLED
ncbi:uncharacterized protein N0V89_009919 [Didymosphaeria variabile]|uniref:Uncharacterized protein n=1 Tax=Didymosphaeria variabile TaxID=1932322 RepID=A0A9W8XER8_9PLEO|nr:uncharacterized protein N0V89_009919 [Didymosphaeria variabile]KAJ4348542.1 hypothetical protein N0V89_009919 [Didymosphaeria variabile]